jgi:hypothetical protein
MSMLEQVEGFFSRTETDRSAFFSTDRLLCVNAHFSTTKGLRSLRLLLEAPGQPESVAHSLSSMSKKLQLQQEIREMSVPRALLLLLFPHGN